MSVPRTAHKEGETTTGDVSTRDRMPKQHRRVCELRSTTDLGSVPRGQFERTRHTLWQYRKSHTPSAAWAIGLPERGDVWSGRGTVWSLKRMRSSKRPTRAIRATLPA
eukprot:782968-Rhodomonas_salina.1